MMLEILKVDIGGNIFTVKTKFLRTHVRKYNLEEISVEIQE